jgi:hypothetical protein
MLLYVDFTAILPSESFVGLKNMVSDDRNTFIYPSELAKSSQTRFAVLFLMSGLKLKVGIHFAIVLVRLGQRFSNWISLILQNLSYY